MFWAMRINVTALMRKREIKCLFSSINKRFTSSLTTYSRIKKTYLALCLHGESHLRSRYFKLFLFYSFVQFLWLLWLWRGVWIMYFDYESNLQLPMANKVEVIWWGGIQVWRKLFFLENHKGEKTKEGFENIHGLT